MIAYVHTIARNACMFSTRVRLRRLSLSRSHGWLPPWHAGACLLAGMLALPHAAFCGDLIVRNTGTADVTCHVVEGSRAGGILTVRAHDVAHVSAPAGGMIGSVDCNGLKTREMHITPGGMDGYLVLNGRQKRVLNVALYPFIPSLPQGNFRALVQHVIAVYQERNPDVLLNAVMNEDVDIYSPTRLLRLLSGSGYDVVELDTLYIAFLAAHGRIAPVRISGDEPWQPGLDAVQYHGGTYAVPSWLCLDFLYSYSPDMRNIHGLEQLLAFVQREPVEKRHISADFSGTTRLPSLYMDGYVQRYGYDHIRDAFRLPPDPQVVASLQRLAVTCTDGKENHCVDGTSSRAADGEVDRIFAEGRSGLDIGFSEQSFYINHFNPAQAASLVMIPVPWGENGQSMLYSDAFVTNRASCAVHRTCRADSTDFTTMMTGREMKTYIAFSHDLPEGTPARHLLVGTRPFWDQQAVRDDPVYRQVRDVVATAQAFPHDLSESLRDRMARAVCLMLRKDIPQYDCDMTRGPM
ncbi:putative lipoprotein [Gluconacetobacter sp. SXCC-1]|nr:putative lipoprotein [Gluconacetobacter sp. SXCC-1]